MAKLHKENRSSASHHHARHSTSSQPRMKAVRLSPAEIRAQNNGEPARSQSQLVPAQSSKSVSERHVTPPPSPTKEQSAYETQLARTASQSQRPPTPPRSPRLSYAKTTATRQNVFPVRQPQVSQYRQSTPIEAYRGIVGTPAPTSSRTSSISGSIKAPMKYRGHEITRTGSTSMFQAPQPDIVMNPLSNFSRPRNKYSPPGSGAGHRQTVSEDTYQAQHRRSDTADSAVSSIPSRSDSPMVRSDSPVSARSVGSRASRQFVIVTEDSLPKAEDGKGKVVISRADTFPAMAPADNSKRSRDTKKTASVELDKGVDPVAEKETKKKRRHTFSWKRKSGMDLKMEPKNDPEAPKEEAAAEKPQPQSAEQPIEEEVAAPTAEEKGKGKEVAQDHGPPVLGVKCCEKCGRIKKLQDDRALLNDGKTKEALVVAGSSAYKLVSTNGDKPASRIANPSGAANAAQLILHRQRRPKPEPPVTLPHDHVVKDFAATSPIETTVEPPVRITRFGSLHGISHEKEIAPQVSALNTSLDSTTSPEAPQMKATSTPIDEPLPEFIFDPTDEDDEFFTPTTQPRRYSFESQRSIINVERPARSFETQKPAPEVVPKAPEPLDLSKPTVLPEPNMGLHFGRSNTTLRGLMLPKGGSSSNLLEDVMKAAGETDEIDRGFAQSDLIDLERQRHQSQVSEIMAV